jgi:hypothetical protein
VTLKPSWHESPPPTSATPRTDRATYGGDVAETARMLGTPFMGWQSLACPLMEPTRVGACGPNARPHLPNVVRPRGACSCRP